MAAPTPQELQRFVRDARFQALQPQDQLSLFRGFLADSDPDEFGTFDLLEQRRVAARTLDYFQPGLLSRVADVAEYVPVVGGAIRGARAVEAGEPASPIVQALGGLVGNPNVQSKFGRAVQEAALDVGLVGAAEGAVALARPWLNALAAKLVGGALETAAPAVGVAAGRVAGREAGLTTEALLSRAMAAPTWSAARPIAAEAARIAPLERFTRHSLEQLTAGEVFGAAHALERRIAGGEQAPFEDFVKTPLGVAALGLGFFGAGELARRFGAASGEAIVATSGRFDPERFRSTVREVGDIVEEVRKASRGRMTREEAADLTLTALSEPVTTVGEVRVLRDAIRNRPELLRSEAGLHILRTQRAIREPDITFVEGPYLRVAYDDAQGRQVVEELSDHAAQRAFAARLRGGDLVLDTVVGDQASILRAGIRAGEPLGAGRTAGGAATLAREAPEPVAEPTGPVALPAIRDEWAVLVENATRELRMPAARSLGDLAASPEALSRLAAERSRGVTYAMVDVRGKGRERPVPATVDRVDVHPGPYEVLVKRGGTQRDVIVEAGQRVPPTKLARVRAAEEARFAAEAAQPPGLPPPRQLVDFASPPAPGAMALTTTRGETVRVLGKADPLGRAQVALPDGTRITARWNGASALFEVPDTFLVTPRVELPLRAPAERAAAVRAQVAPGQVVHQSVRDLKARGARPSAIVTRVEGDRVWVQVGDEVRETTVDAVAATVAEGHGYFGYDMTKPGGLFEELGETLAHRLRSVESVSEATLAEDAKLAAQLWSFEQQTGTGAGSAARARHDGEGLTRAAKRREARPEAERTRGGSKLVKGCKP